MPAKSLLALLLLLSLSVSCTKLAGNRDPVAAVDGNGEPFEGGDAERAALEVERKNLVAVLKRLDANADRMICEMTECPFEEGSPVCAVVAAMTKDERRVCREFIFDNLPQLLALNAGSGQTPFKVVASPILVDGAAVTAGTNLGAAGEILFNYERVRILKAEQKLALLGHEFGHKAIWQLLGKPLADAGGGAATLDEVGASIAVYSHLSAPKLKSIASATGSDGRTALFAVSADGRGLVRWEDRAGGGKYSGTWQPIPGAVSGLDEIAAERGANGRFMVLARKGFVISTIVQDAGAESFTGASTILPGNLKQATLRARLDGTLFVWGVGMDDQAWTGQADRLVAQEWAWELKAAGNYLQMAPLAMGDGTTALFMLDAQKQPIVSWNGGAPQLVHAGGVKQIAPARLSDGRIVVYGIGMDDRLWAQIEDGRGAGTFTAAWKLVASAETVIGISAIGTHVFAVGTDGNLLVIDESESVFRRIP